MKDFFKQLIIRELAFCARLIYKRFRPFVVGVTGSTGKTTTKYMIGELFSGVTDDVMVSRENLNSEYGLPLALLGYKSSPKSALAWLWVFISSPFVASLKFKYAKYVVLEYASDKPGDIAHLIKLVPPDVAVITNIGVAHLQAFKDVASIAREKWELASVAEKIITTKQVVQKVKDLHPVRGDLIIIDSPKTAQVKNIHGYKNKTEFDLEVQGQKFPGIEYSLLGAHNLENILLALMAVVTITGETKKVVKRISKLSAMQGRGLRFVTQDAIIVIDESYNANPVSMIAALSSLEQVGFGRKVAVLGEMKELGSISARAHSEIAKIAKSVSDLTVGVGEGFRDANLDEWYASVKQLNGDLDLILKKDDTVLIKGSESVGLEKTVKILQERK